MFGHQAHPTDDTRTRVPQNYEYMTNDVWNPSQYHRFRDERRRPFEDLLSLVQPIPGGSVIDLGCGTGEPTLEVHRHMGAASTLGIDSSINMLEKARNLQTDQVRFELCDVESLKPDRDYDLIFSNAALHWVADHPVLFGRLSRLLRAGGQLAIQMPANYDQPSHVAAKVVASSWPFREALGGYLHPEHVLDPARYARILFNEGFVEQQVRLQVYGHVLENTSQIAEWTRGTLLTDYQKRMPEPLFEEFISRYRAEVVGKVGDSKPCFFPYKRILIWGRKPQGG